MNNKAQVYPNVDLDTFVLEIPLFQRPLNDSHVEEIKVATQEFVRYGMGTPFPLLSIAKYTDGNVYKFCIIDGQHRYHAYKKLYQQGMKFLIDIHVINCNDINEVFKFYQLCNKRMDHAHSQLQNQITKHSHETDIHTWINSAECSSFFSAQKCQRPRIFIPKFIDKYEKSSVRYKINSLAEFKEYLKSKNDEILAFINKDINGFLRANDMPNNEIYEKAKRINWYLGLNKDLAWIF